MEIIVKVTDAELKEMDVTARNLQACIFDDVVNSDNQCVNHEYSPITIEVVNTDDAKRAIKTTKDKHLAIINNKYEG